MIVTIALRFREQQVIAAVFDLLGGEGWTYKGFIPGPEYTTKSATNALNIGGMTYAMGAVEKDQWFMLVFESSTVSKLPEAFRDIKIGGKEGAFFKSNRAVYLSDRIAVSSGETVRSLFSAESASEMPDIDPATGMPIKPHMSMPFFPKSG